MKIQSPPKKLLKGRGAGFNPDNRYAQWAREAADDGWQTDQSEAPPPTELFVDTARSVIAHNDSPDIGFSQSINPYRGCEHGCVYCYARPSHAYLGLSPGLDFETRIGWKKDAALRLRAELARPRYVCAPIALGVNTDAWQPVERRLKVTRAVLEVLAETHHPVSLISKSGLVLRDLDLLSALARENLVHAAVSITTLDNDLARRLEPRAAAPQRRLQVVRGLAEAGVPVMVNMAPIIPALNDHEVERILQASAEAGARTAGYVLLRLPREVDALFQDWLARHEPGRIEHVMSLVRQMRGGRDYDSRFGTRMRGVGPLAQLLARRFALAKKRFGLDRPLPPLDCSRFVRPRNESPQGSLF